MELRYNMQGAEAGGSTSYRCRYKVAVAADRPKFFRAKNGCVRVRSIAFAEPMAPPVPPDGGKLLPSKEGREDSAITPSLPRAPPAAVCVVD
jgi:hypothetical protein